MKKIIKKTITAFLGIILASVVMGNAVPVNAARKTKAVKTAGTTKTATVSYALSSALIQGANVVVAASGTTTSDDGILHLFAQKVYESGIQGKEVAKAAAGANAVFAFPLGKNTAGSNLYNKFQTVVVKNGALVPVGNAIYIMNPEAAATHTAARRDFGKKGILPAAVKLNDISDLKALGIKQITYNLPVGNLTNGGGINYVYNGKTYSFNAGIVGQYDLIVPKMNAAGIQVSLILLNNLNGSFNLIHPLSRDAVANYYAFNTMEAAGVEELEAVASFLAQRYSNTGHGTVDNWIVGNEVNARQEWNYMNPSAGLATFTNEYAKALRIFYNGIKSENANARVYTCVDQEYAVADGPAHYAGQAFLQTLNAQIAAEGNIGWDVAVHPYNFPLYDPYAWTMTAKPQVTHSQTSRYVTMQNIDVLTDFLCTPAMLSPNGQVKSVLCSESGYTSLNGEQIQAAAVVFAYKQAMANQHIDGYVLNRQLDDAGEIAQGLAVGLENLNGTPKMAYSFYATADSPATQAAAGAIIGADINTLITVR